MPFIAVPPTRAFCRCPTPLPSSANYKGRILIAMSVKVTCRAGPAAFGASDGIVTRFSGDRDPAELGEGVDPGLAAKPSVARCTNTAEWHLRLVLNSRPVDVANAGAN